MKIELTPEQLKDMAKIFNNAIHPTEGGLVVAMLAVPIWTEIEKQVKAFTEGKKLK